VSPWERRKRGGLYYTRSRREGGRVVREYIGSGPVAVLAARMDALERERREEQAALWRQERRELDALDASVDEVAGASDFLVRAALLVSGYRQHNRGEWRKRCEPKEGR
jgi:hypothetical protein